MENENVETVVTENPQVEVKPTEVKPEFKVKSSDVLRELSKTFSVNLFDENGLEMLKEKLDAEKSEYTQLKEVSKTLTEKELLFAQKEQEYEIKITALGLGFPANQLDEVLALAKVNTKEGQTINDGLKVVKEKYGKVFVAHSNIGLQFNDMASDKPNLPRTEQERYLANNPKVQYYNKTKK